MADDTVAFENLPVLGEAAQTFQPTQTAPEAQPVTPTEQPTQVAETPVEQPEQQPKQQFPQEPATQPEPNGKTEEPFVFDPSNFEALVKDDRFIQNTPEGRQQLVNKALAGTLNYLKQNNELTPKKYREFVALSKRVRDKTAEGWGRTLAEGAESVGSGLYHLGAGLVGTAATVPTSPIKSAGLLYANTGEMLTRGNYVLKKALTGKSTELKKAINEFHDYIANGDWLKTDPFTTGDKLMALATKVDNARKAYVGKSKEAFIDAQETSFVHNPEMKRLIYAYMQTGNEEIWKTIDSLLYASPSLKTIELTKKDIIESVSKDPTMRHLAEEASGFLDPVNIGFILFDLASFGATAPEHAATMAGRSVGSSLLKHGATAGAFGIAQTYLNDPTASLSDVAKNTLTFAAMAAVLQGVTSGGKAVFGKKEPIAPTEQPAVQQPTLDPYSHVELPAEQPTERVQQPTKTQIEQVPTNQPQPIKQPSSPQVEQPSASQTTPTGEPTRLTQADIERRAKLLGEEPPEKQKTTIAAIEDAARHSGINSDVLLQMFLDNPKRPITPVELTQLKLYATYLSDEIGKIIDQVENTKEGSQERAKLLNDENYLDGKLRSVRQVLGTKSSQWGTLGKAIQSGTPDQNGYSDLLAHEYRINGGKDIPIERKKALKALADEAEAKRVASEQAEKAVNEFDAGNIAPPAPSVSIPLGELIVQGDTALERLKQSAQTGTVAEKPLSEVVAPKQETTQPPSFSVYADPFLIKTTAHALYVMASEAKTFAKFTVEALKQFGDWIKPHLGKIWANAQKSIEHVIEYVQGAIQAARKTSQTGAIAGKGSAFGGQKYNPIADAAVAVASLLKRGYEMPAAIDTVKKAFPAFTEKDLQVIADNGQKVADIFDKTYELEPTQSSPERDALMKKEKSLDARIEKTINDIAQIKSGNAPELKSAPKPVVNQSILEKQRTLKALQEERKSVQREAGLLDDKINAAYDKRLEAKRKELEQWQNAKRPEDVQTIQKRKQLNRVADEKKREYAEIVAKIEMEKQRVAEAARPAFVRLTNKIVSFLKALTITTLALPIKLGMAVFWSIPTTLAAETFGAAFLRMFDGLSGEQLAKIAGTESSAAGIHGLTQFIKGFSGSFSRIRREIWALGKFKEELMYGEHAGVVAPAQLHDYLYRFHKMFKAPLWLATYEKAVADGLYSKGFTEATAPRDVLLQCREEAINKANDAIMMGHNTMADLVQSMITAGDRQKTAVGAVASFLLKLTNLVTRVPLNIAKYSIYSLLGIPMAAGELVIRRILKDRFAHIDEPTARRLAQQIKMGSLLPIVAYLYENGYVQAGGLYTPNEKQKNGELGAEDLIVFGRELPPSMAHSPIGLAFHAYAALKKGMETEELAGSGDIMQIAHGVYQAGTGYMNAIPFISSGKTLYGALTGDKYQAGRLLSTPLSPLKQFARMQDYTGESDFENFFHIAKPEEYIKRKETGFWGQIQGSIPETPFNPNFNRQNLPIKR